MNFDDFKLAVEAFSGGKNTVIFDDLEMPSIMVRFPRIKNHELLEGASETFHPAFIVNGSLIDDCLLYTSTPRIFAGENSIERYC